MFAQHRHILLDPSTLKGFNCLVFVKYFLLFCTLNEYVAVNIVRNVIYYDLWWTWIVDKTDLAQAHNSPNRHAYKSPTKQDEMACHIDCISGSGRIQRLERRDKKKA